MSIDMKKFFITTPIYYVNAKPHIGHAYTTIAADIMTRFYKLQGQKTFFLTGTDEHGLKIQKKAQETGKDPQQFANEISEEFRILWDKLNIKPDNFIRTTNPEHKESVQKVLQTLCDKGAIYKGEYEGLYCVGCEQFKNESDLVNGKCPDHDIVAENLKEESYILKMTDLQDKLVEKIKSDEFWISPVKYKKEVLSFLENQALKDISISRKNVKWGIPLPFDPEHTTYVWVDAFLNYLTGLGWNGDVSNISKQWPADVQFIGKDILRVHATIWPLILLHLGIELPKILYTHGHILSGGKKMSKTLGNAISIEEMLKKFGSDGTRYLLMSAGVFGDDVDVTMERLTEKYNADLANGLGNLVSRFIKLSEKWEHDKKNKSISTLYISETIKKMELDKALNFIWSEVKNNNKYIEDNKPWELEKKNKKEFNNVMYQIYYGILDIAENLTPFMPETSEKIKKALENKKTVILFPKIK